MNNNNYPSWDAKFWLLKFENSKQFVGGTRPVRADVFKSTLVVNKDCLAFAHELHTQDSTDDLCVLNMASARNPGGGVYNGAGAQEEYLFRCSDYFRFLFQYADPKSFDCEKEYGIPHHSTHTYPLKKNFGGVYSHGVTIFRDVEAKGYALLDQPWQANFVAVAANSRLKGMPY